MTRLLLTLLLVAGCRLPGGGARVPAGAAGPAAAIAHGGVGSPPRLADGCRQGVDTALRILSARGDPLEAAVAGVVVLENDPRFNAGTGSRIRIDGVTIQMDAAVMNSGSRFGAVAAIEGVRNPVRVALAVSRTPHLLLVGDGAIRLARALGMPPYDPATPRARALTRAIQKKLRAGRAPGRWRRFDWRRWWNFRRSLREAGLAGPGQDTVGVAVRAADGRFAVALSTGGTPITLRGRVGDVPILGAGLYAGPFGAVAATGTGERIVEAGLARRVHRWMREGASPRTVSHRAVELLRDRGSIGVIVIGRDSMAAAASRPMAWAARRAGSHRWLGPSPR